MRHYLSDWVYALRRYAEFGSAGVLQRAQETAAATGGELHQEYEVDGVVEFSLPNGASKVRRAAGVRRGRRRGGRVVRVERELAGRDGIGRRGVLAAGRLCDGVL